VTVGTAEEGRFLFPVLPQLSIADNFDVVILLRYELFTAPIQTRVTGRPQIPPGPTDSYICEIPPRARVYEYKRVRNHGGGTYGYTETVIGGGEETCATAGDIFLPEREPYAARALKLMYTRRFIFKTIVAAAVTLANVRRGQKIPPPSSGYCLIIIIRSRVSCLRVFIYKLFYISTWRLLTDPSIPFGLAVLTLETER